MNMVSRYILSVTAAAILTAILQSIAGKGSTGQLVKLIAGVFMALTMVSPLMQLKLPDMDAWFSGFSADGTAAAAVGEKMAEDSAGAIIKTQLETYILDKAAMYQTAVTADVTLDGSGIPVGVTITGDVPPYARSRLADIITSDLGIEEEAQQWIG